LLRYCNSPDPVVYVNSRNPSFQTGLCKQSKWRVSTELYCTSRTFERYWVVADLGGAGDWGMGMALLRSELRSERGAS
jgi:hypothetical protein